MMWIYKVVLALIILCPTSAQAARLAVLEIEQGANQEVLAQIADGLRSGALEAARSSEEEIIVITRESMLMFLKDQGVDPNCVEGECEVDTARNIGADYVIFATLLELEGTFTLSAKLYEVEEGGLLATERTRSSSLLTLIDTTPAVAGSLLAHGLGLSYTPANTSPSYSVPTTNSSADFSGGSDGLDVDQMLAQQQCDDQANAAELEQQTTDFGQEVLNQQEEMTAQWLELAPYLGLCKHVKIPSEYNACIATADEFIHWTNNLKVTLNARHKSIETTCGVRRITLPAVSQSIDIGRSLTAEASMLKGAIIYSWRQSHRTGVVHAFRAGVGSEYLGVGAAYQVGVESLLGWSLSSSFGIGITPCGSSPSFSLEATTGKLKDTNLRVGVQAGINGCSYDPFLRSGLFIEHDVGERYGVGLRYGAHILWTGYYPFWGNAGVLPSISVTYSFSKRTRAQRLIQDYQKAERK